MAPPVPQVRHFAGPGVPHGLFLAKMFSQNIADGGQFFIKRVRSFSEFSQCIQQVIQGWCILGWWAFTPMICNPATRRTEPRHTTTADRINDQRLTAGVTLGVGWKVTLF